MNRYNITYLPRATAKPITYKNVVAYTEAGAVLEVEIKFITGDKTKLDGKYKLRDYHTIPKVELI